MRNFLKRLFGAGGQKAGDSAGSPPPFYPLNELETMLAAACADPAQRRAFQRAMLETPLLAATPEPPRTSAASRTIDAGEKLTLMNVPGPDGEPMAALFTSEQRIVDAFGPGTGFMRAKGEALLELVARSGVWLNPGSAYSVQWTPEEVAMMLGKPARWTVKEATSVMLGEPAAPPEALMAAIRNALRADARVVQAWFALAHWPKVDQWSWYLDVRTELSADEVNELLAGVFRLPALEGRVLDMVVHKPGEPKGSGIALLETPSA